MPTPVAPPSTPAPKLSESSQMLARLEAIERHLGHMDRRDQWRTWTSAAKGIFAIVMTVIALGGSYYLFTHIGDFIKAIAQQTAAQTVQYGKQGSSDFLQQVQGMFK